ncbi:MAG TPA: IS1595 family transposase [Pyrinomonadaceae bacterium]|jgi:transposase-like protein
MMKEENNLPTTLQQAITYFSDKDVCFNFMVSMRWADGVAICQHCGNDQTSFLSTRKIWKCKACKKQFSVKMGTIFEESPIGLDKWLTAMWLIVNAKNGISSYELHRAIGVTQKTAWFMLHRIRLALQNGTFEKLAGDVECDETFVGGKAKNMHKSKREKVIKGRGSVGKTAVMGMLERKGNVRAKVIESVDRETLHSEIKEQVETGSNLFTDEWRSYQGLDEAYVHEVINHSIEYVRDNVHTNGIENFWSLLKRTISGTYVSVEPYHLAKYVEEQVFRYNERKGKDKDRFVKALSQISDKRLTYKELIGDSLTGC